MSKFIEVKPEKFKSPFKLIGGTCNTAKKTGM